MNSAPTISHPRSTTTKRTTLHALGHATSRGFGTGLAMIRLVRLARRDDLCVDLDHNELNRGTGSPPPR